MSIERNTSLQGYTITLHLHCILGKVMQCETLSCVNIAILALEIHQFYLEILEDLDEIYRLNLPSDKIIPDFAMYLISHENG